MLAATLALAILAAAPSAGPLDEIVTLLAAGKCDDAFLLLAQVKAPSPAVEANLAAARSVARGAETCRAVDPVLALSFATLASRLAPDDLEVQLLDAQGLLAVDQRAEAAQVLDRLVARYPAEKAPGAWLMRGKLAAREGEHEVAVRMLTPLARHPESKAEAGPLLAQSERALREQEQGKKALSGLEARAEAAAEAAKKSQDAPGGRVVEAETADEEAEGHAEGVPARKVIGRYDGRIGRNGRTSFTVTGLRPGKAYRFLATGNCRQTGATLGGIDFRVQFGDQPSRSINVSEGGGGLDRSSIRFVADSSQMVVTVYDDSSARSYLRCEIKDFAVESE